MRSAFWTTLLTAFGSLGCGSSTEMAIRGNVQVSFATQAPPGVPPAPAFAVTATNDTITAGSDTIVVTQAQLVLREIELKRVDAGNCAGQPGDCEEVELGPALIDLPLTATVTPVFTDTLPPGTYQRVDFEVHKVTRDAPEDATIRLAHPEFVEKSIRVQGTYNRQAFVYESDLDVEQELRLSPALTVTAGSGSTNLTIRVNLDGWFRSVSGTLLDPASGNKGAVNESLIKDNVKRSMKAFEDRDTDGDERDG